MLKVLQNYPGPFFFFFDSHNMSPWGRDWLHWTVNAHIKCPKHRHLPHRRGKWVHISLDTSPKRLCCLPRPAVHTGTMHVCLKKLSPHKFWHQIEILYTSNTVLTVAKCRRSSPSSFFIFRSRLTTARQGPHHCWYTSTTARTKKRLLVQTFSLQLQQSAQWGSRI